MTLVTGDAGIGKTRLLREMVAALRRDAGPEDTVVAWGSCVRPADTDLPFSPLPAILDDLGQASQDRHVHQSAMRAGAALLGPEPGQPDVLSAGQGRLRLFEAVHDVVRSVTAAGHHEVVLVIDDLHWADPSTLDLVAFLARRLGRVGATLVVACRREGPEGDAGLRALLLDLERDWIVDRVELGPLDAGQVEEQVLAIGAHGHDPTAVAARSEGNPFIVEELLRLPPGRAALPDSLRELLMTRLVGLDAGTCHVVEAAAVIGRPALPGLIGTVAGVRGERLDAALGAATEAGILVRDDAAIAFRHSLLGEATLERIGPSQRCRLHRRAAAALEVVTQGDGSPGLLVEAARHWDLSGEPARSRKAYERAAAAAERTFAWSSAARCYARAADIALDAEGPGPDVVRLARHAAEMWLDASQPMRAQVEVRRAGRIAGRIGLRDEWLRCWAELVNLYNETGALDRGYRLAERILTMSSVLEDGDPGIHPMLAGAAMRILSGRLAAGRPLAEMALSRARELGAWALVASAASLLGHAAAAVGDAEAAASRFEEAIAIAPRQNPDALDTVLINRAVDLLLLGDWDLARSGFARVRSLARSFGADHEPIILAYLRSTEADLALQTGDLGRAMDITAMADATRRELHGHHDLVALEAWAAALAGDVVRARAAVAQGLASMYWCEWHRSRVWTGEALIHLAEGRLDDAQGAATRALRDIAADEGLSDPARVKVVALRVAGDQAVAARARGDGGTLERVAGWARPLADSMMRLADGDADDGYFVQPVNRARGALGVAEWRRAVGQDGEEAWREAVQRLDVAGLGYDAAYARHRLAEALLRRGGERSVVAAELSAALAYARGAPARPLEADIRKLARQARLVVEPPATATCGEVAPAPRATETDPWRLSARERDVLALVAEGRTNREIGEVLFITDKTASSHVTHILDKLGVSSRVEAALLAAAAGIGPSRPEPVGSGTASIGNQASPDAVGGRRS